MSVEVAAYENIRDIENYQNLDPEDSSERRRLDSYTQKQVETHIGERFNAILSVTRYELRDGLIFGVDMNEPFMDSLIRGRNYRRMYGSPLDWPREDAEVWGFASIEKFMADPITPEGETMISISKPGKKAAEEGDEGSIYKHNFIDFFTKKKDENGYYVEARRYSTALNTQEYINFARDQGLDVPDDSDDAFFLSHPFQLATFEGPDEAHKYLHREHEYITQEEYEEIIRACAPLIISYIHALANNDTSWQRVSFNAVLNRADEIFAEIRNGERVIFERGLSDEEIWALGNREVRSVDTGCGSSDGFNMSKDERSAPFSVSQFGNKRNYEFDKFGKCRTCKNDEMLGPCKLCKGCDDKIQEQKRALLN